LRIGGGGAPAIGHGEGGALLFFGVGFGGVHEVAILFGDEEEDFGVRGGEFLRLEKELQGGAGVLLLVAELALGHEVGEAEVGGAEVGRVEEAEEGEASAKEDPGGQGWRSQTKNHARKIAGPGWKGYGKLWNDTERGLHTAPAVLRRGSLLPRNCSAPH
jgi:hypothetical protein